MAPDEQNTVGAGFGINLKTKIDVHAGFNRLQDGFQFQQVVVPAEDFGTRDVVYMDRQRLVLSARGEHHLEISSSISGKSILYSEFHHIGEGSRIDEQLLQETLPSDTGFLVGAELGLYGPESSNYLNFFARFGQGLAAFDELGVPTDSILRRRHPGLMSWSLLSGNWEPSSQWSLMGGAYARNFCRSQYL